MADQNPDDQIDHTNVRDEPTDGVAAHCGRAAAEIDQIARDAKEALADQGIDIDLFFLVPNSGRAIVTSAPLEIPQTMNGTGWARSSDRSSLDRSGWIECGADQSRVPPPTRSLIISPRNLQSSRLNHRSPSMRQ